MRSFSALQLHIISGVLTVKISFMLLLNENGSEDFFLFALFISHPIDLLTSRPLDLPPSNNLLDLKIIIKL